MVTYSGCAGGGAGKESSNERVGIELAGGGGGGAMKSDWVVGGGGKNKSVIGDVNGEGDGVVTDIELL